MKNLLSHLCKAALITFPSKEAERALFPEQRRTLRNLLSSIILSTFSIALELGSIFLLIPLSKTLFPSGSNSSNPHHSLPLNGSSPITEFLTSFWAVLAAIALLRLLQSALDFSRLEINARETHRNSTQVSVSFSQALSKIPLLDLQANHHKIYDIANGVTALGRQIFSHLESLSQTIIRIVLFLAALIKISPMAVLGMTLSIPLVVYSSLKFIKLTAKNAKTQDSLRRNARSNARDLLDNFVTIKTFRAEDWYAEQIRKDEKNLHDSLKEQDRIFNLLEKTQRVLFVLSAIVITTLISLSHKEGGHGIDLIICIYLLSLSLPISGQLGRLIANSGGINERTTNLGFFLSLTNPVNDRENPEDLKIDNINELRVEELYFAFDKIEVLRGINYSFKSGNFYQISGPSGIGKSTLLKELAGLYPPTSGRVVLMRNDSIDSKETTLNHPIPNLISYLDQEPLLFNLSIRENILFSNNNQIRDQEILKVLGELGLTDFINSKPGGLDFILNNNGRSLSRGQRQKLLFARAILSATQIILLDEPFNGMDKTSIEVAIKLLNSYRSDRICIIASHQKLSGLENLKDLKISQGILLEN